MEGVGRDGIDMLDTGAAVQYGLERESASDSGFDESAA
jgi:hypothetical protein